MFKAGDQLVVEAGDDQWCYGYVKSDESQRGIFPAALLMPCGHEPIAATAAAVQALGPVPAEMQVTSKMDRPGSFYHVRIPKSSTGSFGAPTHKILPFLCRLHHRRFACCADRMSSCERRRTKN